MLLAGGIMQHGYQCGMIWGATLAAGAHAYQSYGKEPKSEIISVIAAQKLVETFHNIQGNINCLEITDIDKSSSILKMIYVFLIKGKTIGCIRLSAKYAKAAYSEINSIICDDNIESLSLPISCSATLARKIGLSDMHTVMASGLAGGIGLCGGACGALGAAIWFYGMKRHNKRGNKMDINDPGGLDIIDTFLKCTDYQFECSKIVGRKFKNIKDHSDFLSKEGCTQVIETLAAKLTSI